MRCTDIDSSEVMAVKRYLAPIGWSFGMLILILDGKTAMEGAAEGLTLCLKTLIPSLFPFFVLSMMLTGALSGGGLLLTGILGGYPVGAGNAARAYRAGQLSRDEAERMLVLCNCAGPSFIFGVVGQVLADLQAAFTLWGIYLLSIAVLWLLFPKRGHIPGCCRPFKLQQALFESLRAMAGVCGWVVLFRVALAMLERWLLWLLPKWAKLFVCGMLELSNGCLSLAAAAPGLRFVLAAGFISFGGICVFLQTASVAEGLSLRYYFPGKIFQSVLCMLLASLLAPGAVHPAVQTMLAAISVFFGYALRKSEKRSGNPTAVIV